MLGAELDDSAADWQVLGDPAAWQAVACAAAAAAGASAAAAGGQPALEAVEALGQLPLDAVQLLCRRLVTPAAAAAVCAAVLRVAVLGKARGLAGAAPQCLVQCMQHAGEPGADL